MLTTPLAAGAAEALLAGAVEAAALGLALADAGAAEDDAAEADAGALGLALAALGGTDEVLTDAEPPQAASSMSPTVAVASKRFIPTIVRSGRASALEAGARHALDQVALGDNENQQ